MRALTPASLCFLFPFFLLDVCLLLCPRLAAFLRVLPSHGLDEWREPVPMNSRLIHEGCHMEELHPSTAQGGKGNYNGAPHRADPPCVEMAPYTRVQLLRGPLDPSGSSGLLGHFPPRAPGRVPWPLWARRAPK